MHSQFQTNQEPLDREEQEAIHDLLLFYGPLLHQDKPKAVVDWEYGSSQKERGGGGGGGVVLGEKIDLFQSGDVSRVNMVVSMKGMSGEKEVGVVVLLWDDLLYLTGNAALSQDQQDTLAAATTSLSPGTSSDLLPGHRTVQSCPLTEIWLPVMKKTGKTDAEEQIGSLLVAVEIVPVC